LREHQRHAFVIPGQGATDAQRAIERLVHQPRHLGVVSDGKTGIEIRLQRKLPQQRQAEGVDRTDGNVAAAFLQLAPSDRRDLAAFRRRAQCVQDAIAHLCGGFARERHRQDVGGIDTGTQQVDVAIDQHSRLAGTGRRLQGDIEPGIDRPRPGRAVPIGRLGCQVTRRSWFSG
jgi:hypothetical protein